ncbi:MAG: hypothetical protein ACPGTU_16580 [Myxococcota bacterium]
MKRPILIHVGMPKTGTTSLQMNLFVRHSGIHYLGKPLTVFSREIARLTRGITYDPGLSTENKIAEFEQSVVRPLTSKSELPLVISEEEFSSSTPTSSVSRDEIADRLVRLFPEARILITIRRQQEAIPSLYNHMKQMGLVGKMSFAHWFEAYFDSEEGSSVFDYREIEQRFSSRFGSNRVDLVPFELMRDSSDLFVAHVCELMTADSGEGLRVWGAGEVRNAGKNRPIMCDQQQTRRITQRYRDSNRDLTQIQNLDLERWNYAL